MASRKELRCNHCGFPARRGRVPIIWPENGGTMKAYCGVECWEAVAKVPFPFHRTAHLTAERGE